ncbi:DUF4282 domain-containing protein [Brachybacterium huguangmaarense]|uniref:DUF4282 domain-containing protein n=1 Tax=Brachybacterium huguangmaarense TaxID=1652028 RepID=A0ABY6G230_9MICO|nr:DUF4282 domain-containing protein [Brachybacterium huguangmaarense]UYG16696.1 DUF4282 domain-containing protein [Brachybacterium huguangmaarense]
MSHPNPYGPPPSTTPDPSPWSPIPASGTGTEPTAPASAAAPAPRRENVVVRLLKGLVDFSFRRSVLVDGAGVVYAVCIAAMVLTWLFWLLVASLVGFSSAGYGYYDDELLAPWLPVVVLLLGWIPALLGIIIARVSIEFMTSTVRTAHETQASADLLRHLVARADEAAQQPDADGTHA